MRSFDFFQIDAFTDQPFAGNPAAVMILDAWLPDTTMVKIAAEHNLAETAFLVKREAGHYDLRWFTPAVEVPLCGHATLASAHALYTELGETADRLRFETKSGPLFAERRGGRYSLDLPADPPQKIDLHPSVGKALGAEPLELYLGRLFLLAVYGHERDVRSLAPDLAAVEKLSQWVGKDEVCVTARGEDVDFVSRLFAPSIGIPEDPFTGSTHAMLTPFWSERLGKTELSAHQASARGGDAVCYSSGDRVFLLGNAVTMIRGKISF
ncbi:MAG: PhzF family phenazine biosynthesis protein [Pseudomonadota bacterium]